MVDRGIKGDKPNDPSVASLGKTNLEDLRGWGGSGGGGMGYNCFPPKGEGGVLGYTDLQGGLEGLHGGD